MAPSWLLIGDYQIFLLFALETKMVLAADVRVADGHAWKHTTLSSTWSS
jgi:hypothetical protein